MQRALASSIPESEKEGGTIVGGWWIGDFDLRFGSGRDRRVDAWAGAWAKDSCAQHLEAEIHCNIDWFGKHMP